MPQKKRRAKALDMDAFAAAMHGIRTELPGGAHYVRPESRTFGGLCVTIETIEPFTVRRDLLGPERLQLGTILVDQVGQGRIKKITRRFWGQIYPKSFRYPVALRYEVYHEVEMDWLSVITDGGAVDFNRVPWIEVWEGAIPLREHTVSPLTRAKVEFLPEDWEENYQNHLDDDYAPDWAWLESRPAKWTDSAIRAIGRVMRIVIPPNVVQGFRALLEAPVEKKQGRGRPKNTVLRQAIELLMLWEVPVVEPVIEALFKHLGQKVPHRSSFWIAVKEMGLCTESEGHVDQNTGKLRVNDALVGHSKFVWGLPKEAREAWRAFAKAWRRLQDYVMPEYPAWSVWPRVEASQIISTGPA